MTLESVPPLIGICGITYVGNALHRGALSLDDNPCFDDLLTLFTPVACNSILECDGSLAGNLDDDAALDAFFDLVDFFLSPLLYFLGIIFLSASSCWYMLEGVGLGFLACCLLCFPVGVVTQALVDGNLA